MENKEIYEILKSLNLNKTAESFINEVENIDIKSSSKKGMINKIISHIISSSDSNKQNEIVKINKSKSEGKHKIMNEFLKKVSNNDMRNNNKVITNNIETTEVYKKLFAIMKSNFRFSKFNYKNHHILQISNNKDDCDNAYLENSRRSNSIEGQKFIIGNNISLSDAMNFTSSNNEEPKKEKVKKTDVKNNDIKYDRLKKSKDNKKIIEDNNNSIKQNEILESSVTPVIQVIQKNEGGLISTVEDSYYDEAYENNFSKDEYTEDDDPGFDLYECEEQHFSGTCIKLSQEYDFPNRAIRKLNNKNEIVNAHNKKLEVEESNLIEDMHVIRILDPESVASSLNKGEKTYEVDHLNEKDKKKRKELLPKSTFLPSGDNYYPILYNNTVLDSFSLNIVVDRERTGFEESKDFRVIINSLIAGRYLVLEYLGSAVFSKALKVYFY